MSRTKVTSVTTKTQTMHRDTVFVRHYIHNGRKIRFRQELDNDGMLICQELFINDDDSNDMTDVRPSGYDICLHYEFTRPRREHCDEWLYHMTRIENIPEIKRIGLVPNVGNCYANHWLSFLPDDNSEIYDRLYPGVFLLSGKRIGKRGAKGYRTCKVNINDLDARLLFVDNAWENEKSLFYIGTISPEKLIITR